MYAVKKIKEGLGWEESICWVDWEVEAPFKLRPKGWEGAQTSSEYVKQAKRPSGENALKPVFQQYYLIKYFSWSSFSNFLT